MAKLSLSLAALAAAFLFLVVVDATVRTTVIIDEETNQGRGSHGGQGQQCDQEIQQQDNLRHCQNYMWEKVGQRGGRDVESYYYNPSGRGQGQHFESCCEQLRDMSTECTCRGLERAISQMRQKAQQQEEQQGGSQRWVQEAMSVARDLPGQCRTSPSRCEMRGQQSAWF
ncbi:2S seed storage albumin protein (Fragment) [Linum perenne]